MTRRVDTSPTYLDVDLPQLWHGSRHHIFRETYYVCAGCMAACENLSCHWSDRIGWHLACAQLIWAATAAAAATPRPAELILEKIAPCEGHGSVVGRLVAPPSSSACAGRLPAPPRTRRRHPRPPCPSPRCRSRSTRGPWPASGALAYLAPIQNRPQLRQESRQLPLEANPNANPNNGRETGVLLSRRRGSLWHARRPPSSASEDGF